MKKEELRAIQDHLSVVRHSLDALDRLTGITEPEKAAQAIVLNKHLTTLTKERDEYKEALGKITQYINFNGDTPETVLIARQVLAKWN